MQYKILFLLGHMRSGSSLLTHILVTNPEITGFGETHIKYSSEDDFEKLILKINEHVSNSPIGINYVFDKILHNNMFNNEDILCSEQIYKLFLLRKPEQSLASIIRLKPHWNQKQALWYYSRRLAKLETYAKLINSKERSFFLTHDQLLHNTELVFKSLQNFLSVQQPFSEEYKILPTTGMKFIGDQSEKIKSGRIIRDYQTIETSIEPAIIEKGMQVFNKCINTLLDHCQTI